MEIGLGGIRPRSGESHYPWFLSLTQVTCWLSTQFGLMLRSPLPRWLFLKNYIFTSTFCLVQAQRCFEEIKGDDLFFRFNQELSCCFQKHDIYLEIEITIIFWNTDKKFIEKTKTSILGIPNGTPTTLLVFPSIVQTNQLPDNWTSVDKKNHKDHWD